MSGSLFFDLPRKDLLNPLKMAVSVVEQRQTLPILANVFVQVSGNHLHLLATDSEVEIACTIPLEPDLSVHDGATTIPARKFFDIIRALPDKNTVQVSQEDSRVTIKSGRSRFTLLCLPAEDFPVSQAIDSKFTFKLPQRTFKELLARTAFAMANNDVRYYLNGLCLETTKEQLVVVGTDGHRLALAQAHFDLSAYEPKQVIIPRKAVLELSRLLENSENEMTVAVGETHIEAVISERLTLRSQLIDGRFPDYHAVIPTRADKIIVAECDTLKQTLSRVAILSNEKFKGVRFSLTSGLLEVSSKNPENEVAEEQIEIDYRGEPLEIGFNVTYLLDALAVIPTKEVVMNFIDENSSVLVTPHEIEDLKMVIMPMRL